MIEIAFRQGFGSDRVIQEKKRDGNKECANEKKKENKGQISKMHRGQRGIDFARTNINE